MDQSERELSKMVNQVFSKYKHPKYDKMTSREEMIMSRDVMFIYHVIFSLLLEKQLSYLSKRLEGYYTG